MFEWIDIAPGKLNIFWVSIRTEAIDFPETNTFSNAFRNVFISPSSTDGLKDFIPVTIVGDEKTVWFLGVFVYYCFLSIAAYSVTSCFPLKSVMFNLESSYDILTGPEANKKPLDVSVFLFNGNSMTHCCCK